MKTLIALLLMTTSAYSQTINNATVNIQGANQNVSINQSGGFHSATVDLRGNGISFSGTQSGSVSQSYSITINCGNNCPVNPYIINQY
jgi:hypothetical protein